MVNYLNTKKIVGKTPERPERPPQPPQNPDGTQPPRPPQPAVPALNAEVTVPLKCLSNFWRFPGPDLSWTIDCVLIEHHNNITEPNFMITSTTLYAPLVTLSINDDIQIARKYRETI